ncbi:hypothetical protein VNI00_014763 [Paramarasmius palmivorus]|uniref:Uncharacterized protein n=1 Tax=Paramarasmius palmivorus TaxID=297713 RepID=A0AAW0BU05_9AGAR
MTMEMGAFPRIDPPPTSLNPDNLPNRDVCEIIRSRKQFPIVKLSFKGVKCDAKRWYHLFILAFSGIKFSIIMISTAVRPTSLRMIYGSPPFGNPGSKSSEPSTPSAATKPVPCGVRGVQSVFCYET